MDNALILGIDQSTQGTKALLFDAKGNLVDKQSLPHKQIINAEGYVEHDLDEISANVIKTVQMLVQKDLKRASDISCVGISVQRETVAAWKKSDLKPLYHAIVWQCPRGAKFVNLPEVKSQASAIRDITGLELSEFFSAAKITWLMDNVPEVKAESLKNNLCIGNIDAFLIHFLTEGKTFATEPSNASRTQLMDLEQLSWSEDLCKLFKVPIQALPPILDTDSLFGYTDFKGVLNKKIPIHCAIGDSQGALFGHGCLASGQVKTTYGTGSSIMMNSGNQRSSCLHGIVNSVGWRRQGKLSYVLEGNINYSAGVISWLKDDLKIISDPKETEALARASNPSDNCFLIPAFSGLGAPYFNGAVRGMITGMSRVTGRNEIVRAALDSIAFQVTDVLDLIRRSSKETVTNLCVDGGATSNAYLMQLQSDLTKLPLIVPENAELSGTGAALMAAISHGLCDESVLDNSSFGKNYCPVEDNAEVCSNKLQAWHRAVQAALSY